MSKNKIPDLIWAGDDRWDRGQYWEKSWEDDLRPYVALSASMGCLKERLMDEVWGWAMQNRANLTEYRALGEDTEDEAQESLRWLFDLYFGTKEDRDAR